jgi:diacylglycerol O-acyltransferase / wax synthase
MPYSHYDRLSALDAAFLAIEDESVHMHVGAVARFEAASLRSPDGTLDIERIARFTDVALRQSPRFRQRVASIPWFDHPVWTDDARFNLSYHVRHAALPAPGDERQLKRLAGQIFSQKLDRGKPLWEIWVVEGLEDGRIALILKAHHCMVDGIAGVDLLAALLRLQPDAPWPDVGEWRPRAVPSRERLLADEVWRRAALPLSLMRSAPGLLARPGEAIASAREQLAAVGVAVGGGIAATTPTCLNTPIGPYRRFDWTRLPIEEVRDVGKRMGGTLNDVVLAIVAGAVGRFLARRGEPLGPDARFQVMVPVSVRQPSERGAAGNRVVNFLARLPLGERDPRRRLELTIEETQRLKQARGARGAEILEELSDLTFTGLLAQFLRLEASTRAYNLVVSNVPGPRVPVYLLGARMTDIYPLVPLFSGQALAIGIFSYAGELCFGFCACWDSLPDLHELVEGVERELGALREAVAVPHAV